MNQAQPRTLTPVALAPFLLAAGAFGCLLGCSSGGGASEVAGGDFVVLRTVPANNGKLFLNEAIQIDFSNEWDLASADLNTLSFQVLDQNGNPLSEQPAGRFRVSTSPGDPTLVGSATSGTATSLVMVGGRFPSLGGTAVHFTFSDGSTERRIIGSNTATQLVWTNPTSQPVTAGTEFVIGDSGPRGRRLEFVPRFPTNDTFDDGGFRPGRQYLVQLVGGDRRNQTVLKDMGGKGLRVPVTFRFRTADGTTPAQLFRDTKPGGPRRRGFAVTPGGPLSSGINFLGRRPLEIRVSFDQALNPESSNVPVRLNNDPPLRDIAQRGRIFLEYDDPEPSVGRNSWIPADVDLESNSLSGAEVVLRPVGVLPNNATVRVIVENTLEDMAGESNVADASYNRVFASFQVRDAEVLAAGPPFDHTLGRYQPLFDAVVENFDSVDQIDLGAPFLEPQARLTLEGVQAGFAFEGTNTTTDFEPQVREVILDTVFTQVTPKNGPPINVSGGVFQFRDVRIPPNVTVRGTGLNPMVWLVTGNFTVEGHLNVDGGLGARVDTLNSANFPTAGGVGVAGGGGGGRGSPNSSGRSPNGESGRGPGQVPGGGGQGGRIDCMGCGNPPAGRDGGGSGGGGGSFATQGDPWFPLKSPGGIRFPQQVGGGGYGCAGDNNGRQGVLPGGDAGPIAFRDSRTDNDFWGSGVNISRQIRILGELENPIGGSGGGGGGDRAISCDLNTPNFIADNKGGGGGGGAGVLIVKALGRIEVTATGTISADGGDGGGGEQAGSNSQGGGGGGGSGGMVVLMAGDRIVLHVHGGTYGDDPATPTRIDRDYDFVVSADGGVGLQGDFGIGTVSNPIRDKYPPPPPGVYRWDDQPAGGFGGMGVIQLMAPPGDPQQPSADGTNTVLDDGIDLVENGVPMLGQRKQRFLAWRGFPGASGITREDDYGEPIVLGVENDTQSADGDDADGDIRPSPILLPVPFAQRSRLRSRWIDTGATVRRSVSGTPFDPTEGARGVIEDPAAGFLAGPEFEFSGTIADVDQGDPTQGFADYDDPGTGTVIVQYPPVTDAQDMELLGADGARIQSLNPSGFFDGLPAFEARLDPAGPGLGSVDDRYAHYRAELRNAEGTPLGDFRILSHTDRFLVLSPESGLLPPHEDDLPAGEKDQGAARLQVLAKFFDVETPAEGDDLRDAVAGLGVSYVDSNGKTNPQANVRIGFAFHQDATKAESRGVDPLRYPQQVGTFLYDLADPATADMIRTFHAPYVQWDILFDTRFKSDPLNIVEPPPLSPTTPRPVLKYLVIPYRF